MGQRKERSWDGRIRRAGGTAQSSPKGHTGHSPHQRGTPGTGHTGHSPHQRGTPGTILIKGAHWAQSTPKGHTQHRAHRAQSSPKGHTGHSPHQRGTPAQSSPKGHTGHSPHQRGTPGTVLTKGAHPAQSSSKGHTGHSPHQRGTPSTVLTKGAHWAQCKHASIAGSKQHAEEAPGLRRAPRKRRHRPSDRRPAQQPKAASAGRGGVCRRRCGPWRGCEATTGHERAAAVPRRRRRRQRRGQQVGQPAAAAAASGQRLCRQAAVQAERLQTRAHAYQGVGRRRQAWQSRRIVAHRAVWRVAPHKTGRVHTKLGGIAVWHTGRHGGSTQNWAAWQ
eukprot:365512-Chlamydomonas_euryale.AAC.2